jgi:L,D-peptidoglycan transpeptidase YkuD (ErfK/YbiS/YcfS/YnhG family)
VTDVVVIPDRSDSRRGVLQYRGKEYPCVLGRGGARRDKREGDGATPVGRFPLRRVLYRADRGSKPATLLPLAPIAATDGWCDAPDDPAYNRPVTLPYAASAEQMMREDRLYDIVIVLGHNDDPVVQGAGSAIFLHVAPEDGGPTAGCIALALEHLRTLLAEVAADTAVVVRDPEA